MSITGAQCVAARSLLGWSRIRLTLASGVASGVIKVFETSEHVQPREVISTLTRTLKSAGVIFIDENGAQPWVRMKGGRHANEDQDRG
jgi:hypothetical protein